MDPTAHQTIELNGGADLQGFRQALRILIWSSIPPQQITWRASTNVARFGGGHLPSAYGAAGKPIILPRPVGDLIKRVVCHSDPKKYALLYDLVWRMRRPTAPDPHVYRNAEDSRVKQLHVMANDVAQDIETMRAGLRFRETADQSIGERFIACFEPQHFIIEQAAPVFIDRFPSLDWTLLTPKGSLWWDRKELAIGPPMPAADASEDAAASMVWRVYHESTFNPASTDLGLMREPGPGKPWRTSAGMAAAIRSPRSSTG